MTMDDLRSWSQAMEDSRRTIFCSPELESRVKSAIDALGLTGIYDVVVSSAVPDTAIYVLDHNAIEANTRQVRFPRPVMGHNLNPRRA